MTYKNDYSKEITSITIIILLCMNRWYYKISLYLPNCIKSKLYIILITLVLLEWYNFMLQTNFMPLGWAIKSVNVCSICKYLLPSDFRNVCFNIAFAVGWWDTATYLTSSQAFAIKQLGTYTSVLWPAKVPVGSAPYSSKLALTCRQFFCGLSLLEIT